MPTISLKLPDTLLGDLAREARTRRVSKSAVVRESLERSLRAKSAGPLYALSADLAGSLKGAPKDLADNPKYLDGFGE